MQDFRGKTAFITGGVSGIGLGLAKVFAEAGMKLALTYRSQDHMAQAKEFFDTQDATVEFFKLDVSDRDNYAEVASAVEESLGPVDLLCNNAGVGIKGKLVDSDFKDWDWGLNVNLGGVVNGIMTLLPQLRKNGGGHIVTVSSMSGIFATPNTSIYNTAKFAVVGLMETIRSEMAEDNIGVSVACPGLVSTNIYTGLRSRPKEFEHDKMEVLSDEYLKNSAQIISKGMDAVEYARKVLKGIQRNDLFILTHPEFEQGIRDRFEKILASIPNDEADPERVELESKFTLRNKIYYED